MVSAAELFVVAPLNDVLRNAGQIKVGFLAMTHLHVMS